MCVHQAVVEIDDLPADIDLEEGESFDIRFRVEDAFPLPEVSWFVNAEEYRPELVERTNAREDGEGRFSFEQTVRWASNYGIVLCGKEGGGEGWGKYQMQLIS